MGRNAILAIDQGTTGSTALVVDFEGNAKVLGRKTVDFPQHYPRPGWVEHDLNDIWSSVQKATAGALAQAATHGVEKTDIAAIGITNQRETLCVFDKISSEPIAPAIVWQCRRSTEICKDLKEQGLEPAFRNKTGLVLDPYFSGTKISWLFQNHSAVKRALTGGTARLGTIDTFLVHRLTSGLTYATEPSNASRTLAFNLNSGKWDSELLEAMGIASLAELPEIRNSAGDFGKTKGLGFLPDGIPITGVLGDQQAALAGQACFSPGAAKCTYGTGAFLLTNIGDRARWSDAGLLTTVAWSLEDQMTFALEGSAFIAGAAIQFLRDQFSFLGSASESYELARHETAAPEIYFVPALAGLGAPYWDPNARGAFLGLTRGTTRAQVVRAALEGIAFQVFDLLTAMAQDGGQKLQTLCVDGGAAANDLLMQSQSDFLQLAVDRPHNLETTAFGAALFAALGVGHFSSLADLQAARTTEKMFTPQASAEEVKVKVDGWHRAVAAVRAFADG